MKTLLSTILLLVTLTLNAQSPYQKAMIKGMELISEDLQKASQQFERIAAAEKENWVPAYYVALTNINSSWGQNGKEQTFNYMKKAQDYIDQAEALSPDNVEIMVLQGMLNTCMIQYDSSVYGMKLSGPTTAIYEKALAMAPNNPRVVSNKAQWSMGLARFFNKPTQPYCDEIIRAIELFEKEEQNGFQPRWGMKQAQKSQVECE
ncbi:MAG: hypothetical protein WBG46_11205 [Nonlabens sp.]